MEMYYPDGKYKKDELTDWDIVREVERSPAETTLFMEEPSGIYNKNGDALYMYMSNKYLAQAGLPDMLVTNSKVDEDKYTMIRLLTDSQFESMEE